MLPASSPLPPDMAAAVHVASARALSMRFDVRWYPSLTSTMDVAAEAAQAGAPEGLVILADEQTVGRGRRGRAWSSLPGAGLYLSLVLRPVPLEGRELSLLTLAAGVAVRNAIARGTGLAPELKWPNDLIVGPRKLAGILAEGFGLGTAAPAVVLGIGINAQDAAWPPEVAGRATSLERECGCAIDRAALLQEVLVELAGAYDRLRRGDVDGILQAWRAAAPSAQGALVEWDAGDGPRRGITAGVDERGALLVDTRHGIHRVIAGELRWI